MCTLPNLCMLCHDDVVLFNFFKRALGDYYIGGLKLRSFFTGNEFPKDEKMRMLILNLLFITGALLALVAVVLALLHMCTSVYFDNCNFFIYLKYSSFYLDQYSCDARGGNQAISKTKGGLVRKYI